VSVPSGVHWSVQSPSFAGGVTGLIAGIAGGILTLRQQGGTTHAENIQAAHQLAAGIFAFTPLGPFIALEGELVGLAGKSLEGHLNRKKVRRIKRNIAHAYRRSLNLGHEEFFGARYAAARVGINPEIVAPIFTPTVTTVSRPGGPIRRAIERGKYAGKVRETAAPMYTTVSYDPRASASPFFTPDTGATETERGILIRYGTGPGAEAEREGYARELSSELSRRPFPGRGIVPTVFQRLRR